MNVEPDTAVIGARRHWPAPSLLGLILGAGFGIWNLVITELRPLAEDTPTALLLFYGPMFTVWGVASFAAARRTGRLWEGIKTGAVVAFATFCILDILMIVRVNLFLNELVGRSDWQGLTARFRASEFESLRVYANYEYVTGAPFKILVASTIGAITGMIGGGLGRLGSSGRSALAA